MDFGTDFDTVTDLNFGTFLIFGWILHYLDLAAMKLGFDCHGT